MQELVLIIKKIVRVCLMKGCPSLAGFGRFSLQKIDCRSMAGLPFSPKMRSLRDTAPRFTGKPGYHSTSLCCLYWQRALLWFHGFSAIALAVDYSIVLLGYIPAIKSYTAPGPRLYLYTLSVNKKGDGCRV